MRSAEMRFSMDWKRPQGTCCIAFVVIPLRHADQPELSLSVLIPVAETDTLHSIMLRLLHETYLNRLNKIRLIQFRFLILFISLAFLTFIVLPH